MPMNTSRIITLCYCITFVVAALHFVKIVPLLANISAPNSGQEKVFIPDVHTALAGLKEKNITRFNLMGEFDTEQRHRQGLIDLGYPLQYDEKCPVYVGHLSDALDRNMSIIWKKDDVVIAVSAQ